MARIGFKTRGGDDYGFGHIARTALLVRALRRLDSGVDLVASVEGPDWVKNTVRNLNVEIASDLASAGPFDVAIVDVLEPDAAMVQQVKKAARRVAAFSDMEMPVPDADVVIAPQSLISRSTGGRLLAGPAYFSIAERFAEVDRDARVFPAVAGRLLVNLGGEAHGGAPQRVADLIELIAPEWERIVWITGRGCPAELSARVRSRVSNANVYEFVDDMPELLASADLAIVAGGFIKWEAAYCGTPMIITALVEHQEELGPKFESTGAAVYAGRLDVLPLSELAQTVATLQRDPARRRKMSENGRILIDGRGADRVARAILELATQ